MEINLTCVTSFYRKMNNLARLVGRLSVTTQRLTTTPQCCSFSRPFTSLLNGSGGLTHTSSVLVVKSLDFQPSRNYKVKRVLKRHCAGCYFVKKFGRLYIECDLKPRHKQIQLVPKQGIYRDDYTRGPWWKAVHWGFRNNGRVHKFGDNSEFSKFDWLGGRLGKDI